MGQEPRCENSFGKKSGPSLSPSHLAPFGHSTPVKVTLNTHMLSKSAWSARVPGWVIHSFL